MLEKVKSVPSLQDEERATKAGDGAFQQMGWREGKLHRSTEPCTWAWGGEEPSIPHEWS